MKKVGIGIAVVLCVVLLCGVFYFVKNHAGSDSTDNVELTEVQKIIARDLEENYPSTPREVIKFYNRLINVYYAGDYSQDEFENLLDQAQRLFDQELLENNPREDYKQAVVEEVENYKQRSKEIRQTSVCDSSEVRYLTDESTGDKLAYVTASYFTKEKKTYEKVYQMYVLRKDDDDQWKILNYYKIENTDSEDEDDD